MEFKIRPFETEPKDSYRMTGEIRGTNYVFTVGKTDKSIPTRSIANDAYGVFAIVEEGEFDLGFGFSLTISIDTDEIDFELGIPPGCQICLKQCGDETAALAILKEHDTDPQSVNLLIPPDSSACVYFNSSGFKDGVSYTLNDEPEAEFN